MATPRRCWSALVAGVGLVAVGCTTAGVTLTAGPAPVDPPPEVAVSDRVSAVPPTDGEVLSLLLLGADDGELHGPLGRADAFHLAFLSDDRQAATIVSVPRDAWVPVPGRGTTRINACLVDGPEACVTTVEAHFGITVDHVIVTTLDAFATAIDRLGGVELDVDRPLQLSPEHRLVPGRQLLSGADALVYVRDRSHRADGDLGRSRAQGELLAALHDRLADDPSLAAMAAAAATLRRHTVTDLTEIELVQLGLQVARLDAARITLAQTPGVPTMGGAASVVRLDDTAVPLVQDAADDGQLSPTHAPPG